MFQFLGIDLGSSAVKCLVIDEEGNTLASSRVTLTNNYPQPGFVEQNPEDWWNATVNAIKECLTQIKKLNITSISLSGHMSSPVFLNKSQDVLFPAMMIADKRAELQANWLVKNFYNDFIQSSGNPPINAFAAARLLWVKQNQPEIYQKTERIIFAKDYIRMRMSGIVDTEPTDAGNSLLVDRNSQEWNIELTNNVGLDIAKLAYIRPSMEICGSVNRNCAKITGLLEGTPIVRGAADMACSQIGSGAITNNITAITLSTSIQIIKSVDEIEDIFIGKNTFHPSVISKNLYMMSSLFSGGMSVDWGLRFLNGGEVCENCYLSLSDQMEKYYKYSNQEDPWFLPFLAGSGSPWFQGTDRGAFLNLSTRTNSNSILFSILEGISFNVKDNLDRKRGNETIVIGGGGSRISVWPQLIADVLNQPVHLLQKYDTATLGAAMIAAMGVGCFDSVEKYFPKMNRIGQKLMPNKQQYEMRLERYEIYKQYVELMRTIKGGKPL